MKNNGQIIFIILFCAFVTHQISQKIAGLHFPFFSDYFDPLIGTPLLLYSLLLERRYLWSLGKNYTLGNLEIILATIIITLITEFLFPMISDRFKKDYFDIIAIVVGAFLFASTMNHKTSKN